jgi:hypothetical protein
MEKGDEGLINKIIGYLAIILFGLVSFSILSQIPFYSNWDMELITIIDLYRMTDDLTPQHINHTGAGMYVVLRLFWYLLPFPVKTMPEWISLENPMTALIDSVVQIRYLIIIPLLLSFSFLFKRLGSLLILLSAITLPSIWGYPIQTLRTEIWVIMFYCGAFYFASKENSKNELIVFTLAGLGFITKFQGIFLHTAIVLIYLFHRSPGIWPSLPSKTILRGALVSFIMISLISFAIKAPNDLAIFSVMRAPNLFFFIALSTLLMPFFNSPYLRLLSFSWWVTAGIMLSFLCHFFVGLSLSTSIKYLLFDWRMIFLRILDMNVAKSSIENIFLDSLLRHGLILTVWIIFLTYSWKTFDRNKKVITSFYLLLIIISLKSVTRGGIQDAIWNDFIILFGFTLFNFNHYKKLKYLMSSVLISNLLFLNSYLKSEWLIGYYDINRYWEEVYESPNVQYSEKMKSLTHKKETINSDLLLKYPKTKPQLIPPQLSQ